MNFFGTNSSRPEDRKKELKSTSKESCRTIEKGKRDIEKEIRSLERSEKDLINQIKLAHKAGREADKRSYCKQLVQLRQTKDRLNSTTRQLNEAKTQTTLLAHSALAVETIGSAGAAMAAVNQSIDPVSIQQVMAGFSREMEKVSLAEESWGDVVDMFDGDDVEEGADEVLDQVLDELGLEVGRKLDNIANCPPNSTPGIYDEMEEFLSTELPSSSSSSVKREAQAL